MLQALPESGRAVTVCLTPWRERWSLGVAPCTASRTFTVASSTWWAAGVGGVGVAAGGGLSSHNSLSASASGAVSAAETVLTGAFLGVSFGLYEELLGLYQHPVAACLEPPQWLQVLTGAVQSLALCPLASQLGHPWGPFGFSTFFLLPLALMAATLPAALEWTGIAAVSQTPAQSLSSATVKS